MYPDNQQPNTQPAPQQPNPMQPPITPAESVQAPAPEPAVPQFQPFAPAEPSVAPAATSQEPSTTVTQAQPAPAVPAQSTSRLLSLLNEKAGVLSVAAFGVAFVILSVVTIVDINNTLSTLSSTGAQLGVDIKLPSLFELTRDSITHWVFVNVLSMAWWILGLLPAVALAGYSLFKQGLRNIPALVTIVLSVAIIINTIVK